MMSEIFNNIPLSDPPRNIYDYKKKKTDTKALRRDCLIEKINAKLPHIKRMRSIKRKKIKKTKARIICVRPIIIVMIGSYN